MFILSPLVLSCLGWPYHSIHLSYTPGYNMFEGPHLSLELVMNENGGIIVFNKYDFLGNKNSHESLHYKI